MLLIALLCPVISPTVEPVSMTITFWWPVSQPHTQIRWLSALHRMSFTLLPKTWYSAFWIWLLLPQIFSLPLQSPLAT